MRRLLPLLVVAALAACQVDVEGAPCRGLGLATEDCPAGQGCGLDGRCSERAVAPTCALCAAGSFRCEDTEIQECGTDSDPVCGEWVTQTECEGGLVCGEKSGAPSCECPENQASTYAVAAPGTVSEGGLAPTGATEPPQCRFRSLTAAIRAAADAGGGTVTAMGGTAGEGQPPVMFGSASGETLPIDILPGVTVTSDSSSSGARYAIQLDDPAVTAAVRIHANAGLRDFDVENVEGDSTRDAVELACDGTNTPVALQGVTLRGTAAADDQKKLGHGVSVKDTCGIVAADVVITGMKTDALHVEAKDPTVTSSFLRGALRESGRGVHLKQGVLTLDGVSVEANVGRGIDAGDSTKETALELYAVKVLRNGDTGIAAMNSTRLFIVGSTIFRNGLGASPTVWGPPTYQNSTDTSRKCGGIVLIGSPPAVGSPPEVTEATFRFQRNRVYSNGGDQVLVMLSSTEWPLGATACGTTNTETTVFGCYDTSASGSTVPYRGLVVIDAKADASKIAWRSGVDFPSSQDFAKFGTSDVSDVSLIGDPWYCRLSVALDCSSPDPK